MASFERISTNTLASSPVTATGNLFPGTVDPYMSNGVSGLVRTDGYNGAIYLVLEKTGSGTCTVQPQSNFDGLLSGGSFYNLGYQRVDNQATLTRTVAAIALAGGTQAGVYQILDGAPFMQFVCTVTGSVSVSAWLYLVPV